MSTYRIIDNSADQFAVNMPKHAITEEGAKAIWAAYVKLYGNCQTMETREKRGGIAYTSEIAHWIEARALPTDFDWTVYKVSA